MRLNVLRYVALAWEDRKLDTRAALALLVRRQSRGAGILNGEVRSSGEIVNALTPDGTIVRVRVAEGDVQNLRSVGGDHSGNGEPSLEDALAPLGEAASLIRSKLESLRATKATVEFGMSLSAQSGKLTALLFEAKADASLTVTLEWAAGDKSSARTPAS